MFKTQVGKVTMSLPTTRQILNALNEVGKDINLLMPRVIVCDEASEWFLSEGRIMFSDRGFVMVVFDEPKTIRTWESPYWVNRVVDTKTFRSNQLERI